MLYVLFYMYAVQLNISYIFHASYFEALTLWGSYTEVNVVY